MVCGVLVATAIITADIPRVTTGHPGLFILGWAIVGAGLGLAGVLRAAAYAAAIVAVLATLVMTTPVMSPLVREWIRNDPLPTTPLDAVVVLSAGVHVDGTLNARAAERLVSGIALARTTRTPFLVTTRDGVVFAGRRVDTDSAQRRLVRSLMDSVDWRIVAPVSTTHDEAVRAAELLLPLGKRRIAVVTSPLHTRRACAAFEAAGFRVVCAASDEWTYSAGDVARPFDRIRAFFDYFYERLGIIEYRRRGWLR